MTYVTAKDCPICNSENKTCTKVIDKEIYFCRSLVEHPAFRRGKETSYGHNTYYRIGVGDNATIYDRTEAEDSLLRLPAAEISARCKQMLTLNKRDTREIQRRLHIAKYFDIIQNRFLSVRHGALMSYCIPGCAEDKIWASASGMLILAQDVDGYYTPSQILTYNNPKYVWCSDKYLAKRNQFDELPLNVVNLSYRPLAIILCEGMLKPIIAATENPFSVVIGGSGGRFGTATLAYTLEVLKLRYGKLPVCIAADKGSLDNPNVICAYRKLATQLEEQGVDRITISYCQHADIDER